MSQEAACGSHENDLRQHPVLIEAGNMMTLVDYGMGVDAAARIAKQYTDKCAETARLREQLEHAGPAIDELTKEREEYKMRWLGAVTPEEGDRLRAENEKLRAALKESREALASLDNTNGTDDGLAVIRNGKSIGVIIAQALAE